MSSATPADLDSRSASLESFDLSTARPTCSGCSSPSSTAGIGSVSGPSSSEPHGSSLVVDRGPAAKGSVGGSARPSTVELIGAVSAGTTWADESMGGPSAGAGGAAEPIGGPSAGADGAAEPIGGPSAGADGAAEPIGGPSAGAGGAAPRSPAGAAAAVDDRSWLTDKTTGLVEEAAGFLDGAARLTGEVYSNSSSGISCGDLT